jgi:proteic killer suppression protein
MSRMAVQSFANKALERFFFDGAIPKRAGWSGVARVVARKLDILDYAERLGDLASPPGNRLEALKGNMIGYHSIRINDQWRVIFRWTDAGPMDVDVVDYHQG